MSAKELHVGDTCTVTGWNPGLGSDAKPWPSFTAVIVKTAYERTLLVDVSRAPELSRELKRLTLTGRVIVPRKCVSERAEVAPPAKAFARQGQARGRSRDGVKWTSESARARRKALSEQMLVLYRQGMSQGQAAKRLGKRPETIWRASREFGIGQPVRYAARAIKLNGETTYYEHKKAACEAYGLSLSRTLPGTSFEVPGALVEFGSWIEFEGQYRTFSQDKDND
ncbi:helix-turn-helix domain-containing protein [Lacticaseibacillus daqingensis]|uniref:helix-turn-helix domain-containing protein n=1 Tax=Lacticaseibacillus daqingensis TaxID=2486014 RepID=UPI000F78E005|nr:helix-turn-helix domain-containing protein [Lacticaseibacillus daqingensis]